MAHDLEGNIINVGEVVYVLAAVTDGSKSKRLLRGQVREIQGKAILVWIYEGARIVRVYGQSVVIPRYN